MYGPAAREVLEVGVTVPSTTLGARGVAAHPCVEVADVLIGREPDELDLERFPCVLLDVVGGALDGPGGVPQRAARPDALQEDAPAPLADRVAEEQAMAARELVEDLVGNEPDDLVVHQVVDVLILGEDVVPVPADLALPALGRAMDLHDQRPGQFVEPVDLKAAIATGVADHLGLALLGSHVQKPASVGGASVGSGREETGET